MTTPNTKYTGIPQLYRMLEDIGRNIKDIGATMRGMNGTVDDLMVIYDAISRHPDARTDGISADSFWNDMEE